MLLDNKITITATNDGKEKNSISTSARVDLKVMEILTTLRMAQNDLEEELLMYLNENPAREKEMQEITYGEI